MIKNTSKGFLILTVMLSGVVFSQEQIVSPDGALEASFSLREGVPEYTLTYRRTPVLAQSKLGVSLKEAYRGGFVQTQVVRSAEDREWRPVWGERSVIPDRYTGMTVTLKEQGPLGRLLAIEFRAYNEGLALRYTLLCGADERWEIAGEETAFAFPEGSAAFAIVSTEGTFPQEPILLADLPAQVMPPLTVCLPGTIRASVLEANVVGYPRFRIKRQGHAGQLGVQLFASVTGKGRMTTPWRVVLMGENEARLVENEHLVQTLAPPCAIADTSWIKPGLTISDHGNCRLILAELKKVIDVAHTNGFRYLQIDWGWYGTEWPWTDAEREKFVEVNPDWADETSWKLNTYADPYTVAKGRVPYRPDWKKAHTVVDIDMPELVKYAREHGMGICLYMHGNVLRAHDMDKLFATYEAWGLAGLKPGFVRYGSAEQTDWIRTLVATAARHKLWLCIHDAYLPEGMERTYPNLMLSEGGGGQEGNHPVRQDVILPFTRCLAGPFDFTPHIYEKGKSHAHSMAFFVVYPGPSTVVRGGINELTSKSVNRIGPEKAFLKRVPMNWDETRVLDAKIGHHIVTARRNGKVWFLGGMTGTNAYTASLPLNFLDSEKTYTATIFKDGEQEENGFRPAVMEIRNVRSTDQLNLAMAPAGGLAVIIE